MTTRDDATAALRAWAATQPDLEVEWVGGHGLFTVLPGEHKRTIGVFVSVGDATLLVESHFMRAPDENEAALYRLLLQRHTGSYVLRFAVYETGDVMIVGLLPLAAVTVEEIDRLLGQLLALADGTYDAALRLGFAGYIDREQAWRARVGLGRNPIT